jgi:sugar phosphate isomerase/epimerase
MSPAIFENGVACTRRLWLKAAGALTIGTTLGRSLQAAGAEEPQPAGSRQSGKEPVPLMQIGILLGTFPGPTLEARLDAAKACGLDCVQLSMDCAGLPFMPDAIAPEPLQRIRREAAARAIQIVSLQGTFNMCHPDAEHRRAGVRRLGVLAEACRQIGTSMIHLCTGTRDRENMWRRHPDNDTPVQITGPAGVTVAFEPEVNNVVDSAKKARRLMDEIGSPSLKVTMDAANLFHAGEFARMSEVLDQAFALVGRDIVMAHAKDVSQDGDAGHEPAGYGKLDYFRYLSLLHAYGFKGPLLLHSLSAAQVPGCVAFLREKLARVAAAKK